MKVVFLDLDGVLNSEDYYWRGGCRVHEQEEGMLCEYPPIDPSAVVHLNEILKRSGAFVCLSSTWRKIRTLEQMQGYLSKAGLFMLPRWATPDFFKERPNYLDRSVTMRPVERGDEIAAWLKEMPEVTHFVVLDDDSDMTAVADHHVQTKDRHGLLAEHVPLALEKLGCL